MQKRIVTYIRRLYYNINKKCLYHKLDDFYLELGNCLQVLGNGGRGTVFGFFPRQVGWGMVNGSNPNFSFYSLNLGSIQFCFPRLIFVSGLVLKVIVFLGIQLWVVEHTYLILVLEIVILQEICEKMKRDFRISHIATL